MNILQGVLAGAELLLTAANVLPVLFYVHPRCLSSAGFVLLLCNAQLSLSYFKLIFIRV